MNCELTIFPPRDTCHLLEFNKSFSYTYEDCVTAPAWVSSSFRGVERRDMADEDPQDVAHQNLVPAQEGDTLFRFLRRESRKFVFEFEG